MLNRLKGNFDEFFLDLALCSSYAFFDNLATVFVSGDLCKVLDHCIIDDLSFLICLEQDKTLSDHMVASNITAQFQNPTTFEGFKQKLGYPVRPLIVLDKLLI